MLVLSLCGVDDLTECDLLRRLSDAGGRLRLLVYVPGLYASSSRNEIVLARLAVWFMAELLAVHGAGVNVEEADDGEGNGEVTYDVLVKDAASLVPKLLWLGPAFDPEASDDGTAGFDFACEARGWLKERGGMVSNFPDLQEAYEIDAEAAWEYREEGEEDEG